MLYNESGERNGEVISQAAVAELGGEAHCVFVVNQGLVDAFEIVSRIKYFEKQFVAFLAVFAHQSGEIFHCRSLNLPETEETERLAYCIEYIIAARHLNR